LTSRDARDWSAYEAKANMPNTSVTCRRGSLAKANQRKTKFRTAAEEIGPEWFLGRTAAGVPGKMAIQK
jgi:hypothetical protein